jgi:hypothetical protein
MFVLFSEQQIKRNKHGQLCNRGQVLFLMGGAPPRKDSDGRSHGNVILRLSFPQRASSKAGAKYGSPILSKGLGEAGSDIFPSTSCLCPNKWNNSPTPQRFLSTFTSTSRRLYNMGKLSSSPLLRVSTWKLEPEPSTFAPSSAWSNKDMDPVPPDMRTWTTFNYVTYWISDAANASMWAFASSMLAIGLSWFVTWSYYLTQRTMAKAHLIGGKRSSRLPWGTSLWGSLWY